MVAHICNPRTLEVELKSTLAYVKKNYQKMKEVDALC